MDKISDSGSDAEGSIPSWGTRQKQKQGKIFQNLASKNSSLETNFLFACQMFALKMKNIRLIKRGVLISLCLLLYGKLFAHAFC